jgi:hypothetical protein
LRKIVGSLSETLLEILLFETLQIHCFEQAIRRLLVSMAQFYQPGARVNRSITTFEGTVIVVLLSITANGMS